MFSFSFPIAEPSWRKGKGKRTENCVLFFLCLLDSLRYREKGIATNYHTKARDLLCP